MSNIQPLDTRQHTRRPFLPSDMMSCTHVFVRNDTAKPLLQPPYDGPILVMESTNTISPDRLKPAHIENDPSEHHQTSVWRNNYPNHPSILQNKKEHAKPL
ncbi:hypothetical protein EG68_03482 [Paragonimus skrjabini miyazakii]|uniref:Uncharacterized protein n=1 Tax=Paragonimus skrjabini miyazakii TaxID=59628 RepID=A0A8S9YV49_9TREM|nr:hypothetical protein EG68_03482 [Paragonimus skrjabini miyazakii]